MATVVNKTTLEVRYSVHTPDYSPTEWVINPNLPACEKKYWKVVGNSIQEMNQSEKDDADLAEANANAQAIQNLETIDKQIVNKDKFMRALVQVLLDEINAIRTESGIGLSEKTLSDIQTAVSLEYDAITESGESG